MRPGLPNFSGAVLRGISGASAWASRRSSRSSYIHKLTQVNGGRADDGSPAVWRRTTCWTNQVCKKHRRAAYGNSEERGRNMALRCLRQRRRGQESRRRSIDLLRWSDDKGGWRTQHKQVSSRDSPLPALIATLPECHLTPMFKFMVLPHSACDFLLTKTLTPETENHRIGNF